MICKKSLGVTLGHVRKGKMKCLAGLVACFNKATVGGGCKWVAWPLSMGGVLPMLASSRILGIKPGLDVFGLFIGDFWCARRDWFDSTTLESF